MSVEPHAWQSDEDQYGGDCRICGANATAPWHISEERTRAQTLRALMEAKWRSPHVFNASRKCRWLLPIEIAEDGAAGFVGDIGDVSRK